MWSRGKRYEAVGWNKMNDRNLYLILVRYEGEFAWMVIIDWTENS